jgi:SAM-dependent methyltransferase
MNSESYYHNGGNSALVALLPRDSKRILDVGCGTGSNAALIRSVNPSTHISGITMSQREAERAKEYIDEIHVLDLENGDISFLQDNYFDLILLSHVLEHLRYPAVIADLLIGKAQPGAVICIALPNVVEWRNRAKLLRGQFKYQDDGVMDRTHLRFFTWETVDDLVSDLKGVKMLCKVGSGSVPLWFLRRVLPRQACAKIDDAGCRLLPNLFCSQTIVLLQKIP